MGAGTEVIAKQELSLRPAVSHRARFYMYKFSKNLRKRGEGGERERE